jgi:DNA-binding protein HU-alpha
MRKPELAAAIAEQADLTKDQAARVLNAILDEISTALSRKDSVTLVGFGAIAVPAPARTRKRASQ